MKLEEAIEELRSVTKGPGGGTEWTPEQFSGECGVLPFDRVIATILNAVVSGELERKA